MPQAVKSVPQQPPGTTTQVRVPLSGMQKFYKNFSVSNQESPGHQKKSRGFSALKKKAEKTPEPAEDGGLTIKINQSAVQKFLSHISVVHVAAKEKAHKIVKKDKDYDKHIYENIELKDKHEATKLPGKKVSRNSISLDRPDGKNVLIIKVEDNREKIVKTGGSLSAQNDAKLSKALETFDKILSEFSSSPGNSIPFVPPKLQKAKTCSIIESRCILKKSISDSKSFKDGDSDTGHRPLDKTKSLWNLNDMEEMQLNSKIPTFAPFPTSALLGKNSSKYNTYTISAKGVEKAESVVDSAAKPCDLAKLDVKTRILKKTLSNLPVSPMVPAVGKSKKSERRVSDPHKKSKAARPSGNIVKPASLVKSKTSDNIDLTRAKVFKAKSVCDLNKAPLSSKPLSKTRSSTSLSGSSSKIPVVRGQTAPQSRFSSTRALFISTPGDLTSVDHSKDSGSGRARKLTQEESGHKTASVKNTVSETKSKSSDKKGNVNLIHRNSNEFNEIYKVRARIQQKKQVNPGAAAVEKKLLKSEPVIEDAPLSPVKSIISKIEMQRAKESRPEIVQLSNTKILQPSQNNNLPCVTNASLNSLPSKRKVKTAEIKTPRSLDDPQVELDHFSNEKIVNKALVSSSEDKTYEGHSDCSDDSGHVSNESEPLLDKSTEYGEKLDFKIIEDVISSEVVKMAKKSEVSKPVADGVSNESNEKTSGNKPDLIPDVMVQVEGVNRSVMCQVLPYKVGDKPFCAVPVPAERRLQANKNPETKVLLRAGALLSLEARRDSLLRARIVSLQAACRGVLARRAAARLRVQHVAARCVQRNVRAFLAVRDWPWWRLLVRVAPLLAVNRTEDQLRSRTEELEALKMKTEKLELERADLKHENDKLENKLSEMTAELAVEQSAGSLAAERLGAETSERLRLERDILGLKSANTSLQQTSERLETELMYSRAETSASGGSAEGGSEEESGDSGGKYKRRLQAALRELEAVRRQLRQQHEDDLEQLVNLKKQLEKKVADAYEEVNEQRQVGAQWKRKAQKAASDANDLRLLLDEQGARAALLEKRQRRADGEGQQLQEEVRREKTLRERCQRETDQLQQEKHLLEQNLADLRMELEMKEERLTEASKELQELAYGGKGEEEVGALRKTKHDLEAKCHDQEEELDEMAGQLQLLESHKVRLEMSLEQQRKAARLEAAQRDEEMEEVRAQAAKKVKGLESQLETEHNERSLLLRERHELERRLAALEESARAEAQERDAREARSRKDLKRARALARDAQAVLERREKEAPGKQQLRQLRDKLDDTEVSLRTAVKARQAAEAEAADASAALEESVRGRREAEARAAQAQREGTTTAAQLEEAEEEAAEVMKKYRACVQSLGEEQRAAREASARAAGAEEEARGARERANELQARLAQLDLQHTQGQTAHTDKLELRSKELEARLELEQTARCRLEAQTTRAREAAASSAQAAGAAQARELQQAEEMRKIMRQLRELREELSTVSVRMDEAVRARSEAEARLEAERTESAGARTELREARARIALLQQAISDELSPGENSDSDNDSYSSDESIDTFLANHKISPVANSFTGNNSPKSTDGRQSRSSVSSSKQLSPTKESFA